MSVHPDEAPTTAYATDRRVALSDLYRSEYAGLVRLACLLVDQREVAEELVQEAFVRLDRSWDRVRDPAAQPAYLRSIVMNLARSSLRRRLVARRHRPAPAPDAAPAEDHAVLREDQAEVLAAVRLLPGRQRACIVLRFYEDMTEAQIAQTLGISPGSVKTHLHRAMQALTTRLEALA